jgi:lambda family phage portal protein
MDSDGWWVTNLPGTIQDRSARDRIRAYARDLERNSDIEESIILAFERNVVGLGFKLQAHTKDAAGKDDEATNRDLEALWKEHCRARNFDIQGRQSCTEMLRMGERRLRVDGGVLFVKCYTPGGTVPLCWQMREVDELDSSISMQQKNSNFIVDGIEVNAYGKRIAYWFRKYSPDGYQVIEPERIPAERVIFLEKFKRVSQPREISPFSTSIQRMRQSDGYLGDVTKQARLSACLVAFIKRLIPTGVIGRGPVAAKKQDPETNLDRQDMPAGQFVYGQPGDDVQTINPPQIGSSPRELTAIHQRLTSAAQGLSYEAGSRDCSQVNFASGRLNRDGDIDTYAMEQQYIIEHALYEMYTEFLIAAALAGKTPFTVAELLANKERYMAHEFVGRGWPWTQPLQESNANKIGLETNQTTLARALFPIIVLCFFWPS